MDLDRDGNICAITIEQARERTQIPSFSYEQMPASALRPHWHIRLGLHVRTSRPISLFREQLL
jgi:hypothetical protein